jgi:uncharacterized protein YjbJ (UPF0337 family)
VGSRRPVLRELFFDQPHQEHEEVGAVLGQRVTKRMTGPVMTAGKPISGRRSTMKSGTQDQAEGMLHKVKGKIKEIAGKIGMNPKLEAEGKDENMGGKVQEKVGQVKKVLGK